MVNSILFSAEFPALQGPGADKNIASREQLHADKVWRTTTKAQAFPGWGSCFERTAHHFPEVTGEAPSEVFCAGEISKLPNGLEGLYKIKRRAEIGCRVQKKGKYTNRETEKGWQGVANHMPNPIKWSKQ